MSRMPNAIEREFSRRKRRIAGSVVGEPDHREVGDPGHDEREVEDEHGAHSGARIQAPRPDSFRAGPEGISEYADRGDPSMLATLRRPFANFQRHGMADWAAALTYYGLLSLFPALLALVSLIGLFGDPEGTTETVTDIVTGIGPDSAADTFSGPIESLTNN